MANDQPTNGELAIILRNIREKVEDVSKKLDYTNGKVILNTEYRLRTEGIISLLKWLGLGNIVLFVAYLIDKLS